MLNFGIFCIVVALVILAVVSKKLIFDRGDTSIGIVIVAAIAALFAIVGYGCILMGI